MFVRQATDQPLLMSKRTTIALGLLVAATATLGLSLLLSRRRERLATADPWHPGQPTDPDDDPFAEMIEEGAGLLGQMKAEAAELARRAGLL